MSLFVVANDGDYNVVGCQTFLSAHFFKPNDGNVCVLFHQYC